jgi:cytochrome c biogenesis protein CcmG/thiol:disulfide interchange protein DsbE
LSLAAQRSPRASRRFAALIATIGTLVIVGGVAFAVTSALHRDVNPPDIVLPPASTILGKGAAAPVDYSLPSLSGKVAVSMASELHGRPGVINFFASWCPACQAELSAFAKASAHSGGSVAFIGVDTNDTDPGQALKLAERAGIHYAIGRDPNAGAVATAYGVNHLPTTFIVDRTGHVRDELPGQATTAELERLLAPLLTSPHH